MYAGTSTRLETQYPGLYSLLLETFLVCLGNDVALRRHKQGVAGPLTCGVVPLQSSTGFRADRASPISLTPSLTPPASPHTPKQHPFTPNIPPYLQGHTWRSQPKVAPRGRCLRALMTSSGLTASRLPSAELKTWAGGKPNLDLPAEGPQEQDALPPNGS
ncbi:unnamed protein product [Gadus morhua 'NCC']